jgi:hypothetical protein
MSYNSTTKYMPSDADYSAPESLDFIAQQGVDSPGLRPVAVTMDNIFELAWRVRQMRFRANIAYVSLVSDLTGTITIDSTTDKVNSVEANEITQFSHLDANWLNVEGDSMADDGLGGGPMAGTSAMLLDVTNNTSLLRRLTGSVAHPSFPVWLPVLNIAISSSFTGSLVVSGASGDEDQRCGTAQLLGGRIDIPLYLHSSFSGVLEITSCSVSIDGTRYWEYAGAPGRPVYDANTGIVLMSPFASQR